MALPINFLYSYLYAKQKNVIRKKPCTTVLFLALPPPVNLGILHHNLNRMKSATRFTKPGQNAPTEADHDGILTLLATLLGEIVIIDVLGL